MEAVHLLFPQISGIATVETKLYTIRCIWDKMPLNLQQLMVLYIMIVAALVYSHFTDV